MTQTENTLSAVIQYLSGENQTSLRKSLAQAAELTGRAIIDQRPPLCRVLLPLYRLFQDLRREAEEHIELQRTRLFPTLLNLERLQRTGGEPAFVLDEVLETIRMLSQGQLALSGILDDMRDLTRGYQPPPDSCASYHSLLKALSAIHVELLSQFQVENDLVFPRATELVHKFDRWAGGGLAAPVAHSSPAYR